MSNITEGREYFVSKSYDLKALLPNPETLALDTAGIDLQREFMSEAIIQNVPLAFDPKRAGAQLITALAPHYQKDLCFALIPKAQPASPRIPLVVLFNRPVPLDDMLEVLSEVIEEEIRLCGGDPDKDLQRLTYYNRGTYGRLAAEGKLREP